MRNIFDFNSDWAKPLIGLGAPLSRPNNDVMPKSFISISASLTAFNNAALSKSLMGINASLMGLGASLSRLNNDAMAKSVMSISASLTAFDNAALSKSLMGINASLMGLGTSLSRLNNDTMIKSVMSISKTLNNFQDDWSIDISENSKMDEENMIELQEDLTTIDINNNWQLRLCETINKWKVKNPVIAGLISFILLALLTGFLNSFGETIKSTIVHEQPNTDSKIVLKLDASQNVKIISSVPYYYEIEISSENVSSTTTTGIGFVSKRSIRITPN